MTNRSYITPSDVLTILYPLSTIMSRGVVHTVHSPFVRESYCGGWEILARVCGSSDYDGKLVVKFAECGRKVFKTKRAATARLASYIITSRGV